MYTVGNTLTLTNPKTKGSDTKPIIVIAITITDCPNSNQTAETLDAPAILAHSLRSVETDEFQYQYVAFVHPDAKPCSHFLRDIGFQVQIKESPVEVREIRRNNPFRSLVQDYGCCGIKEFVKLYAYTMTNADVVVHLDMDVMLVGPMDNLYNAMLGRSSDDDDNWVRTIFNRSLPDQVDFFFTRDYVQMSRISNDTSRYGVQAGFFVVRPNQTIFEEMMSVIRIGSYTSQNGWGGKQYGGYYDAAQAQGFLAYFYGEFYPDRAVELDPCIYNSMISHDPITQEGVCRFGPGYLKGDDCFDCRKINMTEMTLIHFTTTAKPWKCHKLLHATQANREMHKEWFRLRKELEATWGRTPPDDGFMVNRTFGFCQRVRPRGYIPMKEPPEVS